MTLPCPQARLNALESMEEESDAHERALASLAALTRRTRSARSPAPALFRGMGPPPPPAAFHGGHGRSGYRTGSGRGLAASSSGRGASSSAGSGFDLGPGAGGWGPMSLSALLLGGGWRGRHRGGGAPPFGGRGVRDMFSSLVGAQLPPHLLFSDRDFTSDDYEALLRLDETVENRKGAAQGCLCRGVQRGDVAAVARCTGEARLLGCRCLLLFVISTRA